VLAGAMNLHRLLASEAPDFFVYVSSAASLLGPLGGSAAEAVEGSFLAALAAERQHVGRPAVSLSWPLRFTNSPSEPAASASALEALAVLERVVLTGGAAPAHVASIAVDWPSFFESRPDIARSPLFERVLEARSAARASHHDGPSRDELLTAAPDERRALLEAYLRAELARLLGLPVSSVDTDTPVTAFGLDSLMAIQLKNQIESRLGVALSIVTMLGGMSIAQIAAKTQEELTVADHPPLNGSATKNGTGHGHHERNGEAARPGRKALDQMVAELDGLSESELDALIDELSDDECPDDDDVP
jgi:acyl carrier protein